MTDKVVRAESLFEVESRMAELMEKISAGEDDDMLLSVLTEEISKVEAKRDRVAAFLRFSESYEDHLKREIERLQARHAVAQRARERLEEYVVRVMGFLGVDRLKGEVSTFALRRNPSRVEVYDQSAVPEEFKVCSTLVRVDKVRVREAIKAGQEVPGASMVEGQLRLDVR